MHRFVFLKLKGVLHKGQVVRHTCDNRECIRPHHLIAGSPQDNVNDQNIRGRTAKGSQVASSVLTEAQVVKIFIASGSQASIGEQFGVSQKSVSLIKNRKTWQHVTANLVN